VADDGFTAFQDAYPRVVGQLRLLTGDLASAEDAAQEAFVRAASRWRHLTRYDQPEAWVRMTAFRLAIDLLRRARRQRGLVARLRARRRRNPRRNGMPGLAERIAARGRRPPPTPMLNPLLVQDATPAPTAPCRSTCWSRTGRRPLPDAAGPPARQSSAASYPRTVNDRVRSALELLPA
jgi:DNA-directed RNA polymerase specialized sigma24 family protein